MYFHVHKQRNTVSGAVFHTSQINHELQKLFVCAAAELRQEKGSPVEGTNIFSGNIQKSTNPNALHTLVGNINTIKQCSM